MFVARRSWPALHTLRQKRAKQTQSPHTEGEDEQESRPRAALKPLQPRVDFRSKRTAPRSHLADG